MKIIPLLPAHRRSLSAVARSIEDSLTDLVSRLNYQQSNALLHKIEPSYSEAEKHEILSDVEELRAVLSEFIQLFDLDPTSVSEAQIVSAHCTHMWALLQGSRFGNLKSYGELNEELQAPLDGMITRLLNLVELLDKAGKKEG